MTFYFIFSAILNISFFQILRFQKFYMRRLKPGASDVSHRERRLVLKVLVSNLIFFVLYLSLSTSPLRGRKNEYSAQRV